MEINNVHFRFRATPHRRNRSFIITYVLVKYGHKRAEIALASIDYSWPTTNAICWEAILIDSIWETFQINRTEKSSPRQNWLEISFRRKF